MGVPIFTIATTDSDFEDISRLNNQTFALEIPQHAPSADGLREDPRHRTNTYVIGRVGGQLAAMASVNDRRPFSLDSKLEHLDTFLPEHRAACEIRLLAVRPEFRRSQILPGLLGRVASLCETRGYDLVLISATTRELRLYRGLGFEPFGPVVGTEEAPYQPMLLTAETYYSSLKPRLQRVGRYPPDVRVNFLPGPSDLAPEVERAFARAPIHHRAPECRDLLRRTRGALAELFGASQAHVFSGSGTAANDLVAGVLAGYSASGVILTNGEFGERLLDHATRAGAQFHAISVPWGAPLALEALEKKLTSHPAPAWVWAVHGETSTGVLNDLSTLSRLCSEAAVPLFLDATSTVGLMPVDLSGCRLSTATSGKALSAVPGLGIVFQGASVPGRGAVPRSLDLAFFDATNGMPYSASSPLLQALYAALSALDPAARSTEAKRGHRQLLEGLPTDVEVVAPAGQELWGVVTLRLPDWIRSEWLGHSLEELGYHTGYRSAYLSARNWLQICFMTPGVSAHVPSLLEALGTLTGPPVQPVPG